MTNSNNKQAVAVKTRVNAGPVYGALVANHNETVAVKTQINAGSARDPQSGLPTGIIAVL